MKEEQNTRMKPVIEKDFECIQQALKLMMVNIVDFAPYALLAFQVDQETQNKNTKRYEINVEDTKIDLEKEIIEDEAGTIGKILLNPDIFLH